MSQFFEAGDFLFVEDITFAYIMKNASHHGMNLIPGFNNDSHFYFKIVSFKIEKIKKEDR